MSDLVRKLSSKKGADVAETARRAASDPALLSLLLKNTRSKNDTLRYNCYRVLLEVSTTTPQALNSEWEVLTGMLESTNNYFRYQAVYLIANVLAADAENRFAGLAERYFTLIEDESIMIASHLALNAGKIARSKPELRERITKILLTAAQGDRDELLHASIIEAFAAFFPDAPRKEDILAYVEGQARSSSQKSRKAAKEFLRTHGRAPS